MIHKITAVGNLVIYLKLICAGLVVLYCSGCTYKAIYRFGELDAAENIKLIDSRRDEDRLAINPCDNGGVANIGDKYIRPSKLELLQSRLGKAITTTEPLEITLTRFNILLITPDSCERSENAAAVVGFAGALGAVLVQLKTSSAQKEGVYCELSYRMNDQDYKGEAFLAAQQGINSLNGPMVSTAGLITPIIRAVDACITGSLRIKDKKISNLGRRCG
jgi:hypothetical protein